MPFGRITCQYFQYVNTLFESLLCQGIENQQKTSLKYTVITPRLRQNERNRAFGCLVAEISVNELQVCFVIHNLVRRYNWAGNTFDLRQRRQDRSIKSLSCILAGVVTANQLKVSGQTVSSTPVTSHREVAVTS